MASTLPPALSKYEPPEYKKKQFHCPYPSCGTFASQHWFFSAIFFPTTNYKGEQRHTVQFVYSYCVHCGKTAIWLDEILVYPEVNTTNLPHKDMPQAVKDIYEEARNIFPASPRGSVALLRLATEVLVNELDANGKDLADKIGDLVSKGLPKRIQESLDILRVIGNNAVHPLGTINLDEESGTASQLFSILNLIVDNQITEKNAINEIYNKLSPGQRGHIKKRDSEHDDEGAKTN